MKKNIRMQILVCQGTGCTSADSIELLENLQKIVADKKLTDVEVKKTGCFGFCGEGPIVKVYPDNVFYTKVKPCDAEERALGRKTFVCFSNY